VENPRLPHENQDKKLNAVVLSTSDRRISTNLSSCPVNRPLPVSFLTEKPWRSPSLSLSSYKYELLQASSSFFLSTISLSLLLVSSPFLSLFTDRLPAKLPSPERFSTSHFLIAKVFLFFKSFLLSLFVSFSV